MPFFTISNNQQNYSTLTLKLVFRFVCAPYFSALYGTNKISRGIDLLFNSNFFQSFCCAGKSFFLSIIPINKRLKVRYFWMTFNLFMIKCSNYSILETLIINIFWIYCCFFIFQPFWRIYI